jgi:hypothetical protein
VPDNRGRLSSRPTRAEVAAALGIPLVIVPGQSGRHAVLLVVVEDSDRALQRLAPLVSRVAGLAWNLDAIAALRRVEEVEAWA